MKTTPDLSKATLEYSGVSFRAMVTPDGEGLLLGAVHLNQTGIRITGNGTLAHPLKAEGPAVNEYDALNAVAEAAQAVTERWDMFRRDVAESIEVVGTMNALKESLVTLSAIRKGKEQE